MWPCAYRTGYWFRDGLYSRPIMVALFHLPVIGLGLLMWPKPGQWDMRGRLMGASGTMFHIPKKPFSLSLGGISVWMWCPDLPLLLLWTSSYARGCVSSLIKYIGVCAAVIGCTLTTLTQGSSKDEISLPPESLLQSTAIVFFLSNKYLLITYYEQGTFENTRLCKANLLPSKAL